MNGSLYIVKGIDSKGREVWTVEPENQSEVDETVAAMSTRPDIVRIVIDIALPRP
jgi:hypothetical protein